MNKNLWVVEMRCKQNWFPTVGASLSRADGLKDLEKWRFNNPDDEFRLTKYLPTKDHPK